MPDADADGTTFEADADGTTSDADTHGTTAVPDADHYVYVLACADGSLYTGYTTDVERRVAEHDAGEGAKYTRGRTPVELVHVESFDSKSAAMSREYEIKQFSRAEKERLVGLD
ncbi:GIY-YIG nuclease family protein [Halobellus limi]|uniref:GIY-YIG nuclease family protein n=1 Tax=Halobellus limi TaxID=699433 RepID=A0A1H5WDP9_9EURY|nr:GIY-YIG nuclease family protein [Halobellus limi]SEF97500.1 putative endonuclease [Halobellus limi]